MSVLTMSEPSHRSHRAGQAALALAAALALLGLASDQAEAGTRAEGHAAGLLEARGLEPGKIDCRGRSCRWTARHRSAGWTYSCGGRARRTGGGWRLSPCRLKPPRLAPLRKQGTPLEAFGYNEVPLFAESQLAMVPGAGADSMRVNLYWSMIEQAPGIYRWGTYDRLYNRMLGLGLRPLFVVLGTPCWHALSVPDCETLFTSMPPADDAFDDYARFAAAAAARYPAAVGFEVWNEPNWQRFWWPGPQPDRYARLLKLTYDRVKAEAPGATVVSAGLFPLGEDIAGVEMNERDFLAAVYMAEGTQIADAIGAHPYPGEVRRRHLRDVRRLIARLRATMVRVGDEAKPVWVTEVGFTTTGYPEERYSQQGQAKRLVQLHQMLSRVPGSPVLYIHSFYDLIGPDSDYWNGMGILHSDRETPKTAYCALAEARGRNC